MSEICVLHSALSLTLLLSVAFIDQMILLISTLILIQNTVMRAAKRSRHQSHAGAHSAPNTAAFLLSPMAQPLFPLRKEIGPWTSSSPFLRHSAQATQASFLRWSRSLPLSSRLLFLLLLLLRQSSRRRSHHCRSNRWTTTTTTTTRMTTAITVTPMMVTTMLMTATPPIPLLLPMTTKNTLA